MFVDWMTALQEHFTDAGEMKSRKSALVPGVRIRYTGLFLQKKIPPDEKRTLLYGDTTGFPYVDRPWRPRSCRGPALRRLRLKSYNLSLYYGFLSNAWFPSSSLSIVILLVDFYSLYHPLMPVLLRSNKGGNWGWWPFCDILVTNLG